MMEQIRKETRAELDRQFKNDLANVLSTAQGRRVFSYLLMSSGVRESMPTGTFADHYNAGRRSMGIELTFACDSIDSEGPTQGMLIRQLAEREYTSYQLGIAEDIRSKYIREGKETLKGRVTNASEEGKKPKNHK